MSEKSGSVKDIRHLSSKERWQLVKDTFSGFELDMSLFHGAALSFYVIFSLVPMFYLAITIFGTFIDPDTIINIITSVLREQVGIEDISGIMDFLKTVNFGKGNFILRNIGIIVLIITCSAIFISLRYSMNYFMGINVVYDSKKKKFISNLIARGISIGLLSLFGTVLIIVYFFQLVTVSFAHEIFGDNGFISSVSIEVLQHILGIATNWVIFAFVFRYLHDGIISWRLSWVGSFVTAVMLHIGQILIQFYLTNFFFGKAGGIAGALLVIIAFVYYSSQMIFLGARFTAIYGKATNRHLRSK